MILSGCPSCFLIQVTLHKHLVNILIRIPFPGLMNRIWATLRFGRLKSKVHWTLWALFQVPLPQLHNPVIQQYRPYGKCWSVYNPLHLLRLQLQSPHCNPKTTHDWYHTTNTSVIFFLRFIKFLRIIYKSLELLYHIFTLNQIKKKSNKPFHLLIHVFIPPMLSLHW